MLRVSSSIAWGQAVTKVTPSLPTSSFSNSKCTPLSLIDFGKGGSPTPSGNVLTSSAAVEWTQLLVLGCSRLQRFITLHSPQELGV